MRYTLADHYEYLTLRYEKSMDADARYEEAAERAGLKLSDELRRIRSLSTPAGRYEAMLELVAAILAEEGGFDALDRFLEHLAQDIDPEPTALVMRWAGEGEYL